MFNTGLGSHEGDGINPDKAKTAGLQLQKNHDGMDYTATMKASLKVEPLANLKKSVKVKGKECPSII